jgi:L-rhamnose mutarotase
MNRVAFKMKLKPGFEAEYAKRHAALWPELVDLLKGQGISEYSIFYDEETHILFGFQKVDGEQGSQDLGENLVVKKWWHFMSDIMDVNEDESPVTVPLREVFFLE